MKRRGSGDSSDEKMEEDRKKKIKAGLILAATALASSGLTALAVNQLHPVLKRDREIQRRAREFAKNF